MPRSMAASSARRRTRSCCTGSATCSIRSLTGYWGSGRFRGRARYGAGDHRGATPARSKASRSRCSTTTRKSRCATACRTACSASPATTSTMPELIEGDGRTPQPRPARHLRCRRAGGLAGAGGPGRRRRRHLPRRHRADRAAVAQDLRGADAVLQGRRRLPRLAERPPEPFHHARPACSRRAACCTMPTSSALPTRPTCWTGPSWPWHACGRCWRSTAWTRSRGAGFGAPSSWTLPGYLPYGGQPGTGGCEGRQAMRDEWPDIPYEPWRETCAALHLFAQILGKYRLARTPLGEPFVACDTLSERPRLHDRAGCGQRRGDRARAGPGRASASGAASSSGATADFALQPMSVAAFHGKMLDLVSASAARPRSTAGRTRSPTPMPFAEDRAERPYDAEAVNRFFRASVAVWSVFQHFRTGFLGKVSPVHLFWGSFDLAVTRFSGRRAPLHPGGVPALPDAVTREAYSHEVSSAGFWPGGGGVDFPAFYSYAYPSPAGFADVRVEPSAAAFHPGLGEFVLPYDAVRTRGRPGGDADAVSPKHVSGRRPARLLGCRRARMRHRRAVEAALALGGRPPSRRGLPNAPPFPSHAA